MKRVALRTHIPFRLSTHGTYSSSVLLTRSNNERRTVKQLLLISVMLFFPIQGLGPPDRLSYRVHLYVAYDTIDGREISRIRSPRGGLTPSPVSMDPVACPAIRPREDAHPTSSTKRYSFIPRRNEPDPAARRGIHTTGRDRTPTTNLTIIEDYLRLA